jgi:acyl transferase domain-containing protein
MSVNGEQSRSGYEVAVIGMAGRFPGADGLDEFWNNLRDGVESIRALSDEELSASGVSRSLLDNPSYVKAGAVIPDIDAFDADFFGFAPREAATMNPQQRIFMECAWEALETAGYDPARYSGRVGVFAGSATNGYLAGYSGTDEISSLQIMVGNDPDYLATRVAYKFNLSGPALTLQTACSTSLVAVHQACQSLVSHECDMALAGGIALLLPQAEGYLYVEGSINSPDGRCRAFSDQAQGTVPGSGAGVVTLKRLDDALADGDPVLAVIKGSAINNDGALKVGYTAPSQEGQAAVIADALAMADVTPASITYVEAHGTATTLGDPIEIAALTQAFREHTEHTGFCHIGSVKTNIGHLGAAAGVAGLIKAVLALQHEAIPPSLHSARANPRIDFARSPFRVATHLTPWPRGGAPRRAGVSSFGIGGTNAHVIVEEAPPTASGSSSRPWQLLVWSAQSPAALAQMSERLHAYLTEHPDRDLADIAYTLQLGRKRLAYGRALVCRDIGEAARTLSQASALTRASTAPARREVVFMFSGQGAQYPGMGRELYDQEPLFREVVDDCAERLRAPLGLELRELLYPAPEAVLDAAELLARTAVTQPALFVIEYALARLWESWGVKPKALIGHSIGEYVAACLAGVFALDDALRIVVERGRLMQAQAPGDMLAVMLDAPELERYLLDGLEVAAINAPTQTVVAGSAAAVGKLSHRLAAQGIRATRLATSHAFHSAMMEPMLATFTEFLRGCRLSAPSVPFISNLTGDWIRPDQATDPAYWAQHARNPVNFAAGIATLVQDPALVLLELGPGAALSAMAQEHPACAAEQVMLASLPQAKDPRPAQQFLLLTLGQLYLHGVDVDWPAFYRHETRRRVALPTYPFQRQRHWIDAPAATPGMAVEHTEKLPLAQWFGTPLWRQSPALPPAPTPARRYLILLDTRELGSRLAALLREAGHAVVTVARGGGFSRAGADHFEVDPSNHQGYRQLWATLHEEHALPQVIVHLWQVTGAGRCDLATTYRDGFDSLLYLAQRLGETGEATSRLVLIGDSVYAVHGDEALVPEKSLAAAACRVIAQEYPALACQSLDVPSDAAQDDRVIAALGNELLRPRDADVLAFRGRRCWVQEFAAQDLSQAPASLLRERGVYFLTAGLSPTGLRFGAVLAERYQARLVLFDSAPLDDPATQAAVAELRAAGSSVLCLRGDAENAARVRQAIEESVARFGALHGVFHIPAPCTNDGLVQLKNPSTARPLFASRIAATLALDSALGDQTLDFLVLFGSSIALTGGVGQVDESAAAAFLDAYAHSRQGAAFARRVVCIDWSLWHWDTRYEQSMAEFLQVQEAFRAHREQFGIRAEEALSAVESALHSGQAQVVASTQGVAGLLEQQRGLTMQAVSVQLEQSKRAPLSATTGGESALDGPTDELEHRIAAVWQDVFGIDRIGRNDNFFSLGGHSLLSIQLISRLRAELALPDLPLSLLYEHPSVAQIAGALRLAQQAADSADLQQLALAGDDDVADLLAEIESLSAEALAAELARTDLGA